MTTSYIFIIYKSKNYINRAKNLVPLLVPLFVSAFRRADELAMAMEARCYRGGAGRTRMKVDAIVDWKLVNGNFKGILIKNPVNADAGLWIGNIERLEKTGVPVIAVHRGCNHQPCCAMAHQVRLARPDIPMLLDPSHMSGEAVKVPELMKKIEELGLDGAMVEVHCDPKSALSDNAQQLTPNQVGHTLNPILSRLCLVSLNSPSDGSEELNWLRVEIDELDERLWDTIAARMEVSERIGKWKKAHGVAPLQPERYQQIVEKLKIKNEEVKNKSLSTDFMLHIWELIHKESLRKQE